MRRCETCGSRFSSEAVFCPHDGNPTVEAFEAADASEPAPADPLLGQVVDGRYRVVRPIGEGGMGRVYEAMHVVLGRPLALKVLRQEMMADADSVRRFFQEARACSAIGHPNIVDISDFGELPDGRAFFAMEFLLGDSLADRIRQGPLSSAEALPILRQIASALGAAHTQGIIHRDVKPENVLLVQGAHGASFVKVLDFGVAKVGDAASKLTQTGMIFGTPHYMSPEQARGEPIDPRTDVYSLGIVAYEMLTGKLPFEADTFMEVLSKQLFEAPATLSDLGRHVGPLEPLVMRALSKHRDDRFETMDAFLQALSVLEAGGRISHAPRELPTPASLSTGGRRLGGAADPEPDPRRDGPAPARRPIALVAALSLLLVGALALLLFLSRSSTPAARSSAPLGAQAAAPPAAPAEPEPAEARTVRLLSDPAGATILHEGVMLGNTPLDLPRPEGDAALLLEIRLPEHRGVTVRLSAESPAELMAHLLAQEPSPPDPGPRRSKSLRNRAELGAQALVPGSVDPPPAMMRSSNRPRGNGTNDVVDPWQ
ncbi:MAG: protein kinase [Myxococcales bacterium]|nr:protein kinase [Myxococcales bacterium]